MMPPKKPSTEENIKLYHSRYYIIRKDELKDYYKEWAKKNKQHLKEYRRRWRLRNKDKVKAASKIWHDKNIDKVRAIRKKFKQRHAKPYRSPNKCQFCNTPLQKFGERDRFCPMCVTITRDGKLIGTMRQLWRPTEKQLWRRQKSKIKPKTSVDIVVIENEEK
jgi:hypothetical protein